MTTTASKYVRCYHSHPSIKLLNGTIYGGSCIDPVECPATIYIGFDSGMSVLRYDPTERAITQQILHPVVDMGIPKDYQSYRNLVDWTIQRLDEGATIHAGCIGGHGRTGMFLAALVKIATGDADAITSLRAMYCEKAVESTAQTKFLHEKFGIKEVPQYKDSMTVAHSKGSYKGYSGKGETGWKSYTGTPGASSKGGFSDPAPKSKKPKGVSEGVDYWSKATARLTLADLI